MSCVAGSLEFDCDKQAELSNQLKDAMDGFGTNEEDIIKTLVAHNNEQRQQLADTYASAYGKPLVDDIVSELTGDLEESVCALLMKPRDYDAKMLHDAIYGPGTDENTIIGILCSRSNDEIAEIKEAYKRLYDDADLIEDLQADCSGYFGRLCFSLATGQRQECDSDDEEATEEAQKLIDAGVGALGTDECDFNSILCLRSQRQLKAVFRKYEEMREHTLEDDIESEMSSDLKTGYQSIVKVTKNKHGYFAERLNKAMRGWGTDDSELIRLIVSRSETDLLWVAEEYEKMYGTPLFDDVKGECSGYYKSLLLSLIAGRYVSKDE